MALVIPATLLMAAAHGRAFELALPIDCEPGKDCWVAHHVDHDAGPGVRDHACGDLAYDGHDGTDFAVPDLQAMREGVRVLAAAAGTVEATRDGMPDATVEANGKAAVQGRECGNGLILRHESGYVSQYCHLRRGSIVVRPGDVVEMGDVLGLVGLSGLTGFPHLHLALRKDEVTLDPFTGGPAEASCAEPKLPLWGAAAAQRLAYQALPLTGLGVVTRPPSLDEVKEGTPDAGRLPASAPALVVWVRGFGFRAGDQIRLILESPSGERVLDHAHRHPKDQAFAMAYAGLRRPQSNWVAGDWRARAEVQRGEQTFTLERRFEVMPGN